MPVSTVVSTHILNRNENPRAHDRESSRQVNELRKMWLAPSQVATRANIPDDILREPRIRGCADTNACSGLAFNSIVNDSRLLKARVPISKICLLLLLNLLQIYYRFASATIYDRAECRS